jgi:hypothetical protein
MHSVAMLWPKTKSVSVSTGLATLGAFFLQVDLSVEVLRAQAALQQCSTDLEKHRWGQQQATKWLLPCTRHGVSVIDSTPRSNGV